MDINMLLRLTANDLALIASIRDREVTTRNAISGDGLELLVQELFPGVDSALLTANKRMPNHLQQGVNRYVTALTRGTLSWEWDGPSDPPTNGTPAQLLGEASTALVHVQEMVVDALCTGKFALFPYVDQGGVLRLSVLSGFLWPIWAEGSSTVLEALLQVIANRKDGKIVYQVRRFVPGLLTVYDGLDDWTKWATATGVDWPQPHSVPGFPVAFRVVNRDANRQPEGLAGAALDAHMAYVKARVLVNFLSHRGGFEERVFYSDKMLALAKDNPRHPLVQDLRSVGPNKMRLGGSADKYERLSPVDLEGYRKLAAEAKADLKDALNMPDVDGELSGEALAEKREAYVETSGSLAGHVQSAMTEALVLASALQPATLRPGWRASLTPRFTRDVQAERQALREDRKAGLPESAWLSGLQSIGVTYVTEDMLASAQAREALDTPIQPGQVDG